MHGLSGNPHLLAARGDGIGQGAVRIGGLLAPTQDGGVARLETEGGDINGDVGARFVDDADDADGHAPLADAQAVGQSASVERLAHGVGQHSDRPNIVGDGRQARFGQQQALQHVLVQPCRSPGLDILAVGAENIELALLNRFGNSPQCIILDIRVKRPQHAGHLSCLFTQFFQFRKHRGPPNPVLIDHLLARSEYG